MHAGRTTALKLNPPFAICRYKISVLLYHYIPCQQTNYIGCTYMCCRTCRVHMDLFEVGGGAQAQTSLGHFQVLWYTICVANTRCIPQVGHVTEAVPVCNVRRQMAISRRRTASLPTGTLPNIRNTLNKKSTRHSSPRIA